MKYLYLLSILSILLIASPSVASEKPFDIRVGIFSMTPLNFIDDSGHASGLYPDLIRKIADNYGWQVYFVPCSWSGGLSMLQNEQIDLMTTIAYSPERAQVMDYTREPVVDIWGQVFTLPENNINSIKDLADKPVAIMTKDITGTNFIKTGHTLGLSFKPVYFDSHDEVFKAVQEKKAIAGVVPHHYGLRNKQSYGLTATTIQFSPFSVYFAAKKGRLHDVLRHIDSQLSRWKQNKDSYYYDRLSYWMGDGNKYEKEIIPEWLLGVIAITASAAAFLLLVNWWLNNTVRRKTQALRTKERQYRDLVEGANSVVLRVDRNGKILFLNKYGFDLFGFSPQEILGKNVLDTIMAKEDSLGASMEGLFRDILLKPESYRLNENENVCKDGRRIYLQWSNSPICNDAGVMDELLCIGIDITDRKRLETELFQAQKLEAVGTLAGGIAHDFNNILSIIVGNAELAKMDLTKTEDIEHNITNILQASGRAKGLVRQILAFSRKTDSEKRSISVSTLAKEIIKMIRATLPATIEIRQRIESEQLIHADPSQIHQIFMNLCTNAFHAMEESGGILGLSVRDVFLRPENPFFAHENIKPGKYIQIEISDTGVGISEHTLTKVFEPYFTTKGQDKGTGMGLAVVHGVITEHKGYVKVYSMPGEGTTFHVYLPIANDDPGSPSEQNELPSIRGGSERIMVIDDEQKIIDASISMLSRHGYEVTGFHDGERALSVFLDQPDNFDLIITDMTMPGITGVDVATRVLEVRPDLPIILCTGFSKLINKEKAMELGIREYVQKPMLMDQLLRSVRDVLDEIGGREG